MRILSLIPLALCMFFPHLVIASANIHPPVFANRLAMTATQTLASPKKDKSSRGKINLMPLRKQTFLFEKDANLVFTYQIQENVNSPLVFIIPGTGGTAEASGALFLAEQMFALGYHTVTVDDAFSWKFAVAGSRSGLPGYTPRDSQDLYKAMQAVKNKLIADKEIRPSSYSVIGYSLGALQTLFMQRIDERERSFRFNKVLMVDPPMDLMHAVKSLDTLYNIGEQLSDGRKLLVFNRVIEVGGKYLNQRADFKDARVLQKAFSELDLNNKDLAYLIGGSFRDSLRDVIFASQQVKDLHILKSPVSRNKRNARYEEARRYSFYQYMSRFLFPQIQKQKGANYDIKMMNDESSFYQFGDYVKTRKNIFIVHTEDDFILKPGDIAWIKKTFKDRALIFPYGGHCGAMNFPQFAEHLKRIF